MFEVLLSMVFEIQVNILFGCLKSYTKKKKNFIQMM